MSHVCLIAADKELPCDSLEPETEPVVFVSSFGTQYEAAMPTGGPCMVTPHEYYRYAVDELGIEMKPFQYELNFQLCQTDLDRLLTYLRTSFSPGEEVELWSLWVGLGGGKVHRYRGRLSEFDLDTLGMLYEIQHEPDPTGEFDELLSQVCLTVEI